MGTCQICGDTKKDEEMIDCCEDCYAPKKKYEKVVLALEKLVFLHGCEQEGIESGQPTPDQWIKAVNEAEEALN